MDKIFYDVSLYVEYFEPFRKVLIKEDDRIRCDLNEPWWFCLGWLGLGVCERRESALGGVNFLRSGGIRGTARKLLYFVLGSQDEF